MNLFKNASRLLSAAVIVAGAAFAEPAVDFGVVAPTLGSVSYAGGSNPLVGTGISVDNVVGINGTPLNDGVTGTCISCFMTFSTGNLSGITNAGPVTLYSFFGGGAINITGTVDFGGGTTVTGTLLSGVFNSASPTVVQFGGSSNVVASSFTGTLNSGIANFYGTQNQANYNGLLNLSFFTAAGSNGSFRSTSIGSGDVIASTPEPVSIILLGTSLVLCGAIWRRRMARS